MNHVIGYNTIREVPLDSMLMEILKRKKAHMRLSQACASYRDGKYELSYSFSDDESLEYETLRIIAHLDEPVPSISDMYPYAGFYENEMKQLFGVNILMTDPDYRDRFYRIKAVTPFLPREAWMDILTPEAEKEKTEAGAAAKEKAVAAAAKEKMAAAAEKPAAAAEKTAADEKTAAKGGQ